MNRIEINSNTQFKKYYSRYIVERSKYSFIKSDADLKRGLTDESDTRTLYYDIYGGSEKYTFIETIPTNAYDILTSNNNLIKPSSIKISNKDKIFFSNSKFPSLLLGRLGLDLKRTTKADSADVIVSDCNLKTHDCFHKLFLFDLDKKVRMDTIDVRYRESKADFVKRINLILQTMKSFFNYDLKLYIQIIPSNLDEYELYNQYSSKFITTSDFTRHVVSQLPILQQEECNNICYMLKSQDKSTVSTALGTLQYYNFFECGIDLLGALTSTNCYDLPINREAEYIYSLLGVNKSIISEAKNYRIKRKIQFLMDSLNKFIITPTMSTREKVINVLRQSLFDQIYGDYKDEFDRLDVTLNLTPNDKNGETNASSSKMEGE